MSFRMFTFVASFQYDCRELKKVVSRDCSSWLQCAGRQNNWIPKSSATSSTYMSKWLRCPSRATSVLPWQPMIIEMSAPIELLLYLVSRQNYSSYQDRRQIILFPNCPFIILLTESYIQGSVLRESNLITVQQDDTYSVYYISVSSSTCFGCWHPSSGARTTVITVIIFEFQLNNESGW